MSKKSKNNVVVATLLGLLAVAALGAWVMMSDTGSNAPATVPGKASVEMSTDSGR